MSLTDREKEIHKAWLHYREIGDEAKKHEVMNQLVHYITNKEDKI